MNAGYVHMLPWGLESSQLGEQLGGPGLLDEGVSEDWFRDLDFSDLPQLTGDVGFADFPILDDLPLLEGSLKGSPDTDFVGSDDLLDTHSSSQSVTKKQLEGESLAQSPLDGQSDEGRENLERRGSFIESSPMMTPFNCYSPPSSSNSGVATSLACLDQISRAEGQQNLVFVAEAQPCRGQEEANVDGKGQIDPSQKKHIRRLRNRELAFESRQRKKSYIKDLEIKCRMLENERNQLQQHVSLTCTENAVLKEEISRLKKMKGSTGGAEPAVLVKDSLPLEFLSHLTCLPLLAGLSLIAGPFPGLFLVVVHCLLLVSKARAGGCARGQVDNRGCTFTEIGGLLEIMQESYSSAILTKRKRSFSFWRRRWRLSLYITFGLRGSHLFFCV